MCNGTMLTHLQFHLVNWFWPADVGVEAASDTRSCATTRLVYRDAQNARYWPSVFILRWAAAPQQPRLRLPESPPGRQRQRTADAPPTPPDPAGRRVCTHKHTHTHTHSDDWLLVICHHQSVSEHIRVPLVSLQQQSPKVPAADWCWHSNNLLLHSGQLHALSEVQHTHLRKYNTHTHTWGRTTHTHLRKNNTNTVLQHTHTRKYYNTHTHSVRTSHHEADDADQLIRVQAGQPESQV